MMIMDYRLLKPEESHDYRALRLESLKRYPSFFHDKYEDLVKIPELKTEQDIIQQCFERFVMGAFWQDRLVGICFFVKDEQGAGNIYQMYVQKQLQGKSIGEGLIQATIQEAFRRFPGINMTLVVAIDNKSAIALYKKIGFEKIENDVSENTIVMRYIS